MEFTTSQEAIRSMFSAHTAPFIAWFSVGPRSLALALSSPRLMSFVWEHILDVILPWLFPPIIVVVSRFFLHQEFQECDWAYCDWRKCSAVRWRQNQAHKQRTSDGERREWVLATSDLLRIRLHLVRQSDLNRMNIFQSKSLPWSG